LKAGAQRQIYDDFLTANENKVNAEGAKQAGEQGADGETAEHDDDYEWENFVVVEKIDIYDEQEMREMEEHDSNEKH